MSITAGISKMELALSNCVILDGIFVASSVLGRKEKKPKYLGSKNLTL